MTESFLLTVIGPRLFLGQPRCPPSTTPPSFYLAPLLFGEALAAGWPWELALHLFAGLRRGRPGAGGLGFIPERGGGRATRPFPVYRWAGHAHDTLSVCLVMHRSLGKVARSDSD